MQRARKLTAATALALTALMTPVAAAAASTIAVETVGDLAPADRPTPRDAVSIAGDPSGAAAVAWLDGETAHVARRAAGGWFAPAARFARVEGVQVALQPGGRMAVVLADPMVRGAFWLGRLYPDGRFTDDLHRVADTSPQLATLTDGTVLAAWGYEEQLYAATLAPGAASWTVERLDDDPRVAVSTLAVRADDAGGAAIAWSAGGGGWSTVSVARRPPGGPFSPAVRVAEGGPGTASPDLQVDAPVRLAADDDALTVTYRTRRREVDRTVTPNVVREVWLTLEGRRWTPGGGWAAPVTLDRADNALTTGASAGGRPTDVAPTGDGGAVLTWQRTAGHGAAPVLRTVRWPAGEAPQPVADETPDGGPFASDGIALAPLGGGGAGGRGAVAVAYGGLAGLRVGPAALPGLLVGGLAPVATGVTVSALTSTSAGHALAAWTERGDGGGRVRVGRFGTVDPGPPEILPPDGDPGWLPGPPDGHVPVWRPDGSSPAPAAPAGPSPTRPTVTPSPTTPPRTTTGRLTGLRVVRAARTGALRLRLRLDARATVRLVLQRRAGGRWRSVRTTSRTLPAGPATVPVTARRPARGTYRVRVTATGADGALRSGAVVVRVG